MKKILTILTIFALTVGTAGITVSAHCGRYRSHRGDCTEKISYCCEKDCTFTDSDGDGYCDECGNKGYFCEKGCTFTDDDNDGICDSCGTKAVCSVKPKAKSKGHCHH
ncbi:MAG: hypothetical protein NC395_04590 [Prevotella sp.]|nr:hypothetical protein [Prevotella sp.]